MGFWGWTMGDTDRPGGIRFVAGFGLIVFGMALAFVWAP